MKIIVLFLLIIVLVIGLYHNFFGTNITEATTISSTEPIDSKNFDDRFLDNDQGLASTGQNERALYSRLSQHGDEKPYTQSTEIDDKLERADDVWLDTDSIANTLERLSIEHNWSEKETLSNNALWGRVCKKADATRNATASLEELMAVNVMLGYQRMLSEVCKDLHLQSEINVLTSFLDSEEFLDNSISQLRSNLVLEQASFGNEDTISLAIELAKEAADRMNESTITEAIAFLAFNELLDTITDDESYNLNYLYASVVQEVAIALLCENDYGCSGSNNPVVLRQCIYRMEVTSATCYKPQSIYEAIYQTLTPLEFIAFESFYLQIIRHDNWR